MKNTYAWDYSGIDETARDYGGRVAPLAVLAIALEDVYGYCFWGPYRDEYTIAPIGTIGLTVQELLDAQPDAVQAFVWLVDFERGFPQVRSDTDWWARVRRA